MKLEGLSKKHQEFVNQYFLCGMNATDAYLKVYPKSSYDSARANAARLLAIDSIQEEIKRRLKERQLGPDEVLARLGDMARGDIADFVGIERPSDLLNSEYQGKTHVIKKFKRHVTRTRHKDGGETENEYTELEMYSALEALEKAGKANGALSGPGENEEKPFVIKVVYGNRRPDGTSEDPPPQAS